MAWRNAETQYGRTARTFHWLVAAMLLGQFSLAFTMVAMPEGELQYKLTNLHESIGITILAITTARLIWRWIDPPPPPLPMPPLMRLGSRIVHGALYAVLFAIPATGYLMTNALGFPVVLFGALPLPDLVGLNRPFGFAVLAAHYWLGMALLVLFAAHAGAALLHHLVLRDGTLRRMLPRRSGDTP
ncbi:MAG: cytochrome b [Alphaproteobacteria bacterium]|nr:cytochrome b [Alphaproteobacteria bacterium]